MLGALEGVHRRLRRSDHIPAAVAVEVDVARARAWMKSGRKIALLYRDSQDRETERVIWPVVIGYLDAARILIGWCELRQGFRTFRTDRVKCATFLEERYPARPSALRAQWFASWRAEPSPQE